MTTNIAAIWIAVCIGSVLLLGVVRAGRLLSRAMFSRGCPRCGFSREGLPDADAVCPECGTPLNRRGTVIRERFAVIGALVACICVCSWFIAEWTVGPVWFDRVALMTKPQLTEARYTTLRQRISHNQAQAGDQTARRPMHRREELVTRYLVSQLDAVDPMSRNYAYYLLIDIVREYENAQAYLAQHALTMPLSDDARSTIVWLCSASRTVSWEMLPTVAEVVDPCLQNLAAISNDRTRELAAGYFFGEIYRMSPFESEVGPSTWTSFMLEYLRLVWKDRGVVDPFFLRTYAMQHMWLPHKKVQSVLERGIAEDTIAADVFMLCGMARLEMELVANERYEGTYQLASVYPLDRRASYDGVFVRFREYLALLPRERQQQILDTAQPSMQYLVSAKQMMPLESYFPGELSP
ncbi:MAG: hypothetical protein H6815_04810 [Phycisphaeraceae bacterium]|nr:hypothetical protein [Phycisphaerales bacterium]MCB9859755.1 hypothetical protein [Phycisphaeraceae bacterium]